MDQTNNDGLQGGYPCAVIVRFPSIAAFL
jgi:hypothetical protein